MITGRDQVWDIRGPGAVIAHLPWGLPVAGRVPSIAILLHACDAQVDSPPGTNRSGNTSASCRSALGTPLG